jgi:glycosidase
LGKYISGSAWEYDEETKEYYLHIFSKKQPDLNWQNQEVRAEIYRMMNWWLDKGIDGFRVDAISHLKKEEGFLDMPNPDNLKYVSSFDKHMNVDGIQDILAEIKEKTFSNYDVMTVGEANGVSSHEAIDWVGEKNGKFSMVFQFEHLYLWNNDNNQNKSDTSVLELQKQLNKLKIDTLTANGIMDDKTKNAIKKFQTITHTTADGIVGQNTRFRLNEVLAMPTISMYSGSATFATMYLQWKLGITNDGVFGLKTKNAVIEYQKKNGLTADGVIGHNTWAKLLR